jgi:hypothetical protein
MRRQVNLCLEALIPPSHKVNILSLNRLTLLHLGEIDNVVQWREESTNLISNSYLERGVY